MNLFHRSLIHSVKRFIQNQNIGILHKCLRKAKTLPLAKRILANRFLIIRIKTKRNRTFLADTRSAIPDMFCKKEQVLQARLIRQKTRTLDNDTRRGRKVSHCLIRRHRTVTQFWIPFQRLYCQPGIH